MKKRLKIKYILPILFLTSLSIFTFSCSTQQTQKYKILLSSNKSYLDQDVQHNSLTIDANVYENNISKHNAYVTWSYRLPSYVSVQGVTNRNQITFVLQTGEQTQSQTITIYAYYEKASTTISFSIRPFIPPVYSNTITLNQTNGTLTQTNKSISVTATISGPQSGNTVTWTIDSNIPNFIEISGQSTNTITFTLKNDESTRSGNFNIVASTIDAANKTFVLSTEDWELWHMNAIPLSYLDIAGSVLKGIKSGSSYDISLYDELHIPINITTISNNAFSNLASNIVSLDFASSNLSSIGNSAFENTYFTNTLTFNSNLTTLGHDAFKDSEISGIDTSNCHFLKTIPYGCFSECSNLTNIVFNDEIEEFQSPPTGFDTGAFQFITKPSYFNGTIIFPANLKTIGFGTFVSLGKGVSSSSWNINLDFSKCTQLTTIGQSAFESLAFDGELILPNTITTITNGAFSTIRDSSLTKGLKKVMLPSSLQSMGRIIFDYCSLLNEVTITRTTYVPYEDTQFSTAPFNKWLRYTKIDPSGDGSVSPDPSSKIYVPSSLISVYRTNWPARFYNFFFAI